MEPEWYKSLKSHFKHKDTKKEDSKSADKGNQKPMLSPEDIQRIFKIIKKYNQ
ncbi:MAG: hypothetical protein RBG13Loki_3359 [Promethearchaeota archaeon CR_4]|nr:MAG: hypothetical protein RBG13Loki_3359 [Candidatus Lokiarchaeota archaeon CR_4]